MKAKVLTKTSREWFTENWASLADFGGEWIAYDDTGVKFHDAKLDVVITKMDENKMELILHFVNPLDHYRPIRFRALRFRALKANNWKPYYNVFLKGKRKIGVSMLVDSGADFTLVSTEIGHQLGLKVRDDEVFPTAEGVGGNVVEISFHRIKLYLDSEEIEIPVGWLQNSDYDELLLGREVVFDYFDVEFKQAEKTILFKKRAEIAS
jgi:Aspartyl protease